MLSFCHLKYIGDSSGLYLAQIILFLSPVSCCKNMYQFKIQNLKIKNDVISLKSVILDLKQSSELY